MKWLHFKVSCIGTTTMMLFKPLKQCKIGSILSSEKNVMLKLECTILSLANICPHKWTNESFYPFCEDDRDSCRKIREFMTGRTSIMLTRKAGVTFIRDSPNICKSIVAIETSQLYPFSISQDISIGLRGATSLDSFLKAYKASETKSFSLTSGLTVRTSSRIKNYLHTKPFSVSL